ncbi:MAG: class I adenylate-forming enzyme family protein [Alphaproteobacteria bacterium]
MTIGLVEPLAGRTVPTALEAMARRRPDAPAIVSPAGTIGFAALVGAIERRAAWLMSNGLQPGMSAGLVMDDSPTDLIAFLALFRLGVAVLPISADEAPAERRMLLDAVGAVACIGKSACRAPGESRWIDMEAFGDGDPHILPPPPGPDDRAHYNRSSGTTLGQPKIIAISHGQRADRVVREAAGFVGPGDRLLHIVPLVNSFSRGVVLATLASGGTLVFPPAELSFAVLGSVLAENGVTAMALTPPLVRDMLRNPREGRLLPGVRLMVGTAPLPVAQRLEARRRLTPLLFIHYATNETGPLAIATPADLDADPRCAGRATTGVEAQVVDDRSRALPPGAMGALRVREAGFPDDYVFAPAGSASRFVEGWFYPGDAATMDEAGRITIHGRIDDVINVGGRKVHPSAIEAWLAADPRVVEAAAVGMRAQRMGEVPMAAVVLRAPATEAELLDLCRSAGGGLPLPRRILVLPELPRNAAGKIDRRRLVALFTAQFGS